MSAGINSGNDDILGDGETGSFADLNNLIKISTDSLSLTSNYKYQGSSDDNGINISKSILIDFNGYTIDGNNAAQGFTVTADNVVLKNVNIQNVISANQAGAVYWAGDNGQLINVKINNAKNTVDGYAYSGGISWWGNNGTINKLDITGCDALSSNGRKGSALSCAGLYLKIYNSTFHDMTSTGSYGVIGILGSSFNVLFSGCNFTETYTSGNFGVFFYEGTAKLTLDDCRFIQSRNSKCVLMNRGSTSFYSNCYFETPGILCIDADYSSFTNCTFNLLSRFANSNTMMDTYFDNCTFIKCSEIYHPRTGSIDTFVNCKFKDCTNIDFTPLDNNGGYVIIEKCTFDNSYSSKDSVVYIGFGSKNIVKDNVFINTPKTYDILINTGVTSLVSGNTRSGGGNAKVQNNGANLVYYDELYVTTTGTGVGTQSNPCSLDFAFSHIAKDGTVHIADGTYNLNGKAYNVNFYIENSKNVIFTNGDVLTLKNGYSLKDLTFTKFTNNIYLGFDSSITNCVIKDSDYGALMPLYLSYTSSVYNCTISNVATTTGIIHHNGHGINSLTVDGLDITNSKFDYFIVTYQGASNGLFKNINIQKSNFTDILRQTASGVYLDCNNIRFVNVNITDCNIADTLITSNPLYARSISFENINVKNSKYAGTDPFIDMYDNCKLINLNIDGLTKTSSNIILINVSKTGCTISGVELADFNTGFDLIRSTASYNLSGLVLNNVNAKSAFVSVGDSSFSKLDFTKTYFTDVITTLKSNDVLSDSSFDDYKGDIQVRGNNVKITGTDFSNGKINTAHVNGGAIELVSGDNFIIDDCNFTSNSATKGGAVYINNVTNSSYIMNSVFTGNTATNSGGAIYIETGIYYYVDENTRATLSTTARNNDLYKETGVKETLNDVWVKWGATGDGNYANPTNLDDAFDKVSPYGNIHFFEGTLPYTTFAREECNKPGLTFMGNNTVITNFAIHASEYAIGLTINNIMFKDYSKESVIIWDADNGRLINCTFKDNGGLDVIKGAAIQINGNDFKIINSTFSNNAATNVDEICYGGAIYVNGNGLTISNSSFTGSNVHGFGSHIYLTEDSENILICNDSKFADGVFTTTGGSAIYSDSEYNITISDSVFTNNKGANGGALNINRVVNILNIYGNTFESNTATVGNGGAIIFNPSNVYNIVMHDNNYTLNKATAGAGGAIYTNAKIAEENSNFTSNSASTGGAINVHECDFEITNSNFVKNQATNGGAIYLYDTPSATIGYCNFTENKATTNGGAIVFYGAGSVDNCNFTSNTANDGSAIYIYSDIEDVEVKNSHFINNVASNHGTIYLTGAISPSLSENTFSGNTPEGSAENYYQLTDYTTPIAYVSESGTGYGLTEDDPTSLTKALEIIENNGQIIVLDTLSNVEKTISNKNIAIVGRTGASIKGSSKYIFILAITKKSK